MILLIFFIPFFFFSHLFSLLFSILHLFSFSESDCAIIRELSIFNTYKDPGSYISLGSRVLSRDGVYRFSGNMREPPVNSSPFDSSSSKPYTTVSFPTSYSTTISNHNTFSEVFASVIIPPHMIRNDSATEVSFLNALGVKVISRCEYLKSEFLPNIRNLMVHFPLETEKALIYMLRELKSLSNEDPSLPQLLRNCSFIPATSPLSGVSNFSTAPSVPVTTTPTAITPSTNEATTKTSTETTAKTNASDKLYKPYELFDPRDLDLFALLDSTRFPSIAFRSEDTLRALSLIGLGTTLEWPDLIACAHSISDLGKQSLGDSVDTKLAVTRGRALLHFMDKSLMRLLGPDKKEMEKEKEINKEKSVKLSLLNGFRSLFTDKNDGHDGESPADKILKDYITQLNTIEWIPVLTHTTHPCMPWTTRTVRTPHVHSSVLTNRECGIGVGGEGYLAAAVNCRPKGEAWLCSASKRLVDDIIEDPTFGSRSATLSPQLLQVNFRNHYLYPQLYLAVQCVAYISTFISHNNVL